MTLEQWTSVIQSAEDANEIHRVLFEYAREKVPANVSFELWHRRMDCGMDFVSGRTEGRKEWCLEGNVAYVLEEVSPETRSLETKVRPPIVENVRRLKLLPL